MRPKLTLLEETLLNQIIEEAFGLLLDPGVRVHNDEALRLLAEAGATVDFENQIARIPEVIVRKALDSAPQEFHLHDLEGSPVVHYGGDSVQFDPGSAAINILDSETLEQRQPVTSDFVKFVRLVETIPQLDAQSTAMICADVPEEIGDLYRLYIALNFMKKPIVTGAFDITTWWTMKELLEARVGGEKALAEKPVAIFDVCPSPPLLWSDITCQNLIDCAKSMVPAELVSMPLAGATAPVTIAGAVVQHAAENLSGITISQLTRAGAPIVWGGLTGSLRHAQGDHAHGCCGNLDDRLCLRSSGEVAGSPNPRLFGDDRFESGRRSSGFGSCRGDLDGRTYGNQHGIRCGDDGFRELPEL